jgi:DNA polymerase III delta prime subunit
VWINLTEDVNFLTKGESVMKKLTNVQKILKALKSGPKTQVDLVRETKVKNVYQIISDLKKKKLVFMDTGKYVHLHTPKETESLNAKSSEQLGAAPPKPESEIITTLRGEVENIQDGIRSLMMARSYLLRRIEEEKRNA